MQQNEAKLVNAWLWKYHRDKLQWKRVRLGPLPSHSLAKMYMVTLRWADAVVVDKGTVYIIEAKLKPNAGAIGQLLQYQSLFKDTPEFSQIANYPVKLIYLASEMRIDIYEMCKKYNIEFIWFDMEKEEVKQINSS